MKYIDAEKLKEIVDRVYKQYEYDYGISAAGSNMRWIYDAIDSLQQEQPIQVNTLTWKDINDLERIINNVHYEFRNGIGEKSFGEEVLERFREERGEQPEIDLEKEIDKIWNPRFNLGWDEKSLLSINHEGFTTIAKHFYELGLNKGKE